MVVKKPVPLPLLIKSKKQADESWKEILKNRHKYTINEYVQAMVSCDVADWALIERNWKIQSEKFNKEKLYVF